MSATTKQIRIETAQGPIPGSYGNFYSISYKENGEVKTLNISERNLTNVTLLKPGASALYTEKVYDANKAPSKLLTVEIPQACGYFIMR